MRAGAIDFVESRVEEEAEVRKVWAVHQPFISAKYLHLLEATTHIPFQADTKQLHSIKLSGFYRKVWIQGTAEVREESFLFLPTHGTASQLEESPRGGGGRSIGWKKRSACCSNLPKKSLSLWMEETLGLGWVSECGTARRQWDALSLAEPSITEARPNTWKKHFWWLMWHPTDIGICTLIISIQRFDLFTLFKANQRLRLKRKIKRIILLILVYNISGIKIENLTRTSRIGQQSQRTLYMIFLDQRVLIQLVFEESDSK